MSEDVAPPPRGNTKGWRYFNEDSGWEWTVQHPTDAAVIAAQCFD